MFEFLLVLVCGFLFRGFGDLHDGLSDRGVYFGGTVGWWSWHIINWLRRDLMQFTIILWAVWKFIDGSEMSPEAGWLLLCGTLIITGFISYIEHHILYSFGFTHRGWFKLGPVKLWRGVSVIRFGINGER